MNKSIIIFSSLLTMITITAFGLIVNKDATIRKIVTCKYSNNSNEINSAHSEYQLNFTYIVESRFIRTVTKERIDKAVSVLDLIPNDPGDFTLDYKNIELTIFDEDRQNWKIYRGYDEYFNETQIQVLKSMDYSTSFSITGNVRKIVGLGSLAYDTLIQYMSVVPEQPAVYKNGNNALIYYLSENSAEEIKVANDYDLQPGKISFIVTINGEIEEVMLTNSCGYSSINDRMIEVVQNIPGSWEVATNAKGEKVEQELVFFFGREGC